VTIKFEPSANEPRLAVAENRRMTLDELLSKLEL
jgi:hypothetical protein